MQEKMEEKKSKAGKILAILVAAAAVIALVAVLARPSERKGSPLFEKEAQVIENETCGFTFTLPAGYTRYVLRDADSTGRSIATYYALGRDNDIAEYHRAWADEIKRSHPEATEGNVTGIVQDAVGKVFSRVLEDAGVYKRTPEGKAAFMKFVQTLGTKEK